MSGLLKKRSLEENCVENSGKRFHGRTEQQNLHTSEEFEFDEDFQDTEENSCVSEEAVCAVLRGLEEEIGVMSSFRSEKGISGLNSGGDSVPSDLYGVSESGIDLCYLIGASDDELGIPPTEVFSSEDEGKGCFPSGEEDSGFSVDLNENGELIYFLEEWQFEDDFTNSAKISLTEDAASTAWDLFVDGDYSQS